MLHDKIQELEIELEDSNTDIEEEVVVNRIETLKCVVGHLFNLKSGSDETRAIKIAEANNDLRQTKHLRSHVIKIQDLESEISAVMYNQNH
jgi:hypothetical protein